jgi:hypothetical protein
MLPERGIVGVAALAEDVIFATVGTPTIPDLRGLPSAGPRARSSLNT